MSLGISRFPWLKAVAACVALGLHAGVLAMVLSSRVVTVALGQPEAFDVQFVELGPAAEPTPAAASADPELQPEPEVEPEPPPELEPAPEPEPQVVSEPEPPVEPEPDPVVEQPEPEGVVKPPPPAPRPEPKPKPKPKPVIKPRPRPKPVSRPRPPAPAPVAQPTAEASGGAPKASQARGERTAPDVDRPRTVAQVEYLGRRPRPAYPRLSERRGEQGRVVLRVLISPQGQVADVRVQRSSGYGRLDEAAIAAMRQARFRPYTENGIAYKALVVVPFDFVL